MKRLLLLAFTFSFLCLTAQAQNLANPSAGAPAGGPAAQMTASGVFNLNATSLPIWRQCLATVRLGSGRCRIISLSDSTGMGAGAGVSGTTNLVSAFTVSSFNDFARLLTSVTSVSNASIIGDQNVTTAGTPVTYPQYNPHLVYGSGWGVATTSLGGLAFRLTNGTSGTLAYSPGVPIDTVNLIYIKSAAPNNGSFTVNVDGGPALVNTVGTSQISTNGVFAMATTTYNSTVISKGQHTINIVPNNDGGLNILGYIPYDSTVSAVDTIQAGYAGATDATFASSTFVFSPLPVLNYLSPSLTFIDLTVNPSNAGPVTPSYISNIQLIITQAKLTGDAILMVGIPSNSVNATNGVLDGYVAELQTLAQQNNIPLLSVKTRFVSYAVTNPIFPYFDNLHEQALGYWDVGLAMQEMVASP